VHAGNAPLLRRHLPVLPKFRRRVVTQQEFCCRLPCATGRVAMIRPPSRGASQLASAAAPAARRFAASRIANVNGGCAALSKAATPAPRSTLPPEHGAPDSNTTPLLRRLPGRRPRNQVPRQRRSAVCCRGPPAP
jgi:hypothetical protein